MGGKVTGLGKASCPQALLSLGGNRGVSFVAYYLLVFLSLASCGQHHQKVPRTVPNLHPASELCTTAHGCSRTSNGAPSTTLSPEQRNQAAESSATSESEAIARRLLADAPRRPQIFIYPMKNPNFTTLAEPEDEVIKNSKHSIHALEFIFLDMLRDSPFKTDDPAQADYFYFPVYLKHGKSQDFNLMIQEMKAFGPWWEKKGGADHLWVIVDDMGKCNYWWGFPNASIAIQHFGRVHNALEANPCNLLEEWGNQCDVHMLLAEKPSGRQPCHRMFNDIVVPPPYIFEHHGKELDPSTFSPENRPHLLFFAGPITPTKHHERHQSNPFTDALYSQGVRQTVYRMWQNYTDFKLYDQHIPNYSQELRNSLFCLSTLGWGWGARTKAAIMHGCIPFIIQPDTRVEWEEQLPLVDYAVRMPFYMIPKLPAILQQLKKDRKHEAMARAMSCAWRFHSWTHPAGRAFEMVMCELKARLLSQRPILNTTTCMLTCGDNVVIDVPKSQPFFV